MSAPVTMPAQIHQGDGPLSSLVVLPLKSLCALVAAPDLIFLAALTAMLFRPPDLQGFPIDRMAFAILLLAVAVPVSLRRQRTRTDAASWPMLALLLLGLWGVLARPYEPQAWSVLAAKWIVPVALFHIAGTVFQDEVALRRLEKFSVAVLVYLTVVSVLFLFDLKALIFPRFILDEGIGIHADRARGPFLQAVANGVSLNILGLVALHSFEQKRLNRFLAGLLLFTVPLAILATRTRAVWLSAALSVGALVLFRHRRRLRAAALALCALAALGAGLALVYEEDSGALTERLQDRSPVEFRLEMYRAGWQMFLEKPIAGWGSEASIQPEIAKRVGSFHPDYFIFHNTYLELAVERGLVGLGLYTWLVVCFFQLARKPTRQKHTCPGFLGEPFLALWALVLIVYFVNASAVVMNYQFLNGFVFTLAGILSAQKASAENVDTRASIVSPT